MPYDKVNDPWVDLPTTTTPINAAALDQIEEGISDATTTAEATATSLSGHAATGTGAHGIPDPTTILVDGDVGSTIQPYSATLASTTATFTTTKDTKLTGIEDGADVTTATTIDAANGVICCRWSGSIWEARPSGAQWGVVFKSGNDENATPPDDVNLLPGDVWEQHPNGPDV